MTAVPVSDKRYTACIIERKDLSEDLWLIRVDPAGPFQFKQYATLGVDYGEKRIERAYSIVSSPYEQALELFVELVLQGELTPHLYCCEVPWFKFVTTISRPWEDAAWKGETGRVDDLVPLRSSQHVRERPRHPRARRLAEGFHVRRGSFQSRQRSGCRVARLRLA